MAENLEASFSGLSEDDGLGAYPIAKTHEFLTIREMACETGTTPRALRVYEAKGLLSPKR